MPRDAENLKQWQAGARERLRADPVRHGRYKAYLSNRHQERSAEDPAYVEGRRTKGREYMRTLRRNSPARKEYERRWAKETREKDIVKALWKSARSRAKEKGVAFDVSVEYLRSIWTGRCKLTGLPFQIGKGRQCLYSASLDKIDPVRGYVEGNCRFILASVNWFKGAGTDSEMLSIARALLNTTGG